MRISIFLLLSFCILKKINCQSSNQLGGLRNDKTSLNTGEMLRSDNGHFDLVMQDDGNLVIINRWLKTARWSTQTAGTDAVRAVMQQSDGNFVLYNSQMRAVWASNTLGSENSKLILQDDGNLVIYNTSGKAIWNSGTVLKPGELDRMESKRRSILSSRSKTSYSSNSRGELSYTFYSNNCTYDVFKSSTNSCGNMRVVGRVSKGKDVTITLDPGEESYVRVVEFGRSVCTNNYIRWSGKLSAVNLSKDNFIRQEVYHSNCN